MNMVEFDELNVEEYDDDLYQLADLSFMIKMNTNELYLQRLSMKVDRKE